MVASGSANRTVGCLLRTVAKGCKTITHSPESVACGYPDRSITRVGVSKQELSMCPSGHATRHAGRS